jgi:hypothetical protein
MKKQQQRSDFMKKLLALFCALALSASLCACGAASAPAGSAASSASSAGAASGGQSRPADGTIPMSVEGETEDVPATLYESGCYSVYIPNEGWTQVSSMEADGSDCWAANDNTEVTFQIARFTGVSAADAKDRLMQDFGGVYDLQEGGNDWYIGASDGIDAQFQLFGESGGDYYYLILLYPEEAVEGFGARLNAIAETMQLA